MKHMAELDLEGTLIQIYPGDSVGKWGKILHVTAEGIMVKVTKVTRAAGLQPMGGKWALFNSSVGAN